MIIKHPEIRIKYAWLLANATTESLRRHYSPDKTPRSYEEYDGIARQYREFWEPYEKRVLDAMYEVTGLTFRQNIIDVYVAPWFYAFSDPLVLGVVFDTQEKLVANLTHELCHRLFMDNRSHDDSKSTDEWKKLFGDHDFVTLVHIPVHAVMHAVFIDILNEPAILNEDKHESKEYKASWTYVEQHGYENIARQLRELYKK